MKGSESTMPVNGAETLIDAKTTQSPVGDGRNARAIADSKPLRREVPRRGAGAIGKTIQRQAERSASSWPAEAAAGMSRRSAASAPPKPKPSLTRFAKE
jgi:hypothetical protein